MKFNDYTAPHPSDDDRTRVMVFAEGPEWDELNGRKWFHVRNPRLLATYHVLDSRFDKGLAEIEALHPGTVLVY